MASLALYTKTKLRGLGPPANYTDRATAACRRIECHVVGVTDSYGRILGFLCLEASRE
jgi:hypothetical protein